MIMVVLEFLTGIVALLTAVLVLILLLLGKRKTDKIQEKAAEIEQKAVEIERKTDEIHVLVNSRLTAVLERVEQLTSALEQENVPVPDPPAGKRNV